MYKTVLAAMSVFCLLLQGMALSQRPVVSTGSIDKAFESSGRATDESGLPVPGAQVFVYETSRRFLSGTDESKAIARTASNADGGFLVSVNAKNADGVRMSYAIVIVTKKGFAPVGEYWDLSKGIGKAFTLIKASTLSGIVVDSRGAPIPEAKVTVSPKVRNAGGSRYNSTIAGAMGLFTVATDAQGRFGFANIPVAALTHVKAEAQGYCEDSPMIWAIGKGFETGTSDIRIVLKRPAIVAGKVVDEKTSEPVAEASVVLLTVGDRYYGNESAKAVTDKDGSFRIECAPGNYAAMVVTDRRVADAPYAVPVKVEGQEGVTVNIVLALTKGEPVEVSVADAMAGGPLSDCRVVLRTALRETGFLQRFGVTDAAGKATVWAAPGKYQVEVSKQDYYVRGDRQIVDVEKGKTVRLAIEMLNQSVVEVKGVVTDYLDEAVADAEISMCYRRIYPKPDDPSGGIFVLNTCKSGDNGSFSMFVNRQIGESRQQIGGGTIIATKDGYARLTRNVRGFYGDPIKLKLEESRTVAGTVVDTQGRPVSGARVDLQRMWGAAVSNSILPENMRFTALTDEDGRFVINAVGEPWIVKVDITAEGFLRTGRTETDDRQRGGFRFTDDPEKAVITLYRHSWITGRVVEKATSRPLAEKNVMISGGKPYRQRYPAKTDQEGSFEILCYPGKYAISLNQSQAKPWYSERLEATVEEGGSTAVLLEAVQGLNVELHVTNIVTQEPMEDVEIDMDPSGPGSWVHGETDAGGIIRYRLAPGDYYPVLQRKQEYNLVFAPGCLHVGEDTEGNIYRAQLLPRSWYWGFVQDKAGNPVSGADVCLRPESKALTKTNDNGEFLFQIKADLDRPWSKIRSHNEKKHGLLVKHSQEGFVGGEGVTEKRRTARITLKTALMACGTIVGPDGQAVGSPQLIFTLPANKYFGGMTYHPECDGDGRFEISHIPYVGDGIWYSVKVLAAGHGTASARASMHSNKNEQGKLDFGRIELPSKSLSVQGTVYSTRGEFLENITIEVDRGDRQTYNPVVTDASGVFRIENLSPGEVVLRPRSDSYSADRVYVQAGEQNVEIIMTPPRYILTEEEKQGIIERNKKKGLQSNFNSKLFQIVKDEEEKVRVSSTEIKPGMGELVVSVTDAQTGKPVARSSVDLRRSRQTIYLHPDKNGIASVILPPGSVTVSHVQGFDGYILKRLDHNTAIVAGQTETVSVVLDRRPVVEATLKYSDGNLFPEADVKLFPAYQNVIKRTSPGKYSVSWDLGYERDPYLGPQVLIAEHPRKSLIGIAEITADTDEVDVILERTVTLKGVVWKESSQQNPMARPLFAVKVDVYDPSGKHKIHEQMARCNDDGSYVVEGLPARCNYRIYVERSYPRPIFQVKAEQTLPGATIELDATVFQSPDLSVSGTVVTEEGHVPEYCTITVVGDSQPHRRISLRRESDFTITGLEEGPLELEVTVPKTYIAENPQTGGVRRFSRGREDFRTRVRTFAGATDVRIVVKEERIAVDPEEIERMWAEDEQEFQQNDKRTISELRMD